MQTPRSIHLLGICGTGMGSFAGLLKAAGHHVRGSDDNVYPPMSEKLEAWGIEVKKGYRAENLDPAPDLVIIGNVIRRTNPEAQAVVERGLEYTSFPKALGELFLQHTHSVVVAGTHGKTTTTSLLAWMLSSAGRDPGLLVGGVPGNFGEGFRVGGGEHFVVEGDEYDTAYFDKVPKFIHYHPRTAIITSIEFDHADIYESVERIESEFDRLVALLPGNGLLIACASDERVLRCAGKARCQVVTYTARPEIDADLRAEGIRVSERGTEFEVVTKDGARRTFALPLAGLHNVENALAAIAFADHAGLSREEITRGLESFLGVARRQTVRAEVSGVRIIDDFAHHPTAVKETVTAVRLRYPTGRLFSVFEPRSATSSRAYFQAQYTQSFEGASSVIIAEVGRPEIAAEERLDIDRLAKDLNLPERPAIAIRNVEQIVEHLRHEARPGDTILIMSNGAFGGIYGKLEQALAQPA